MVILRVAGGLGNQLFQYAAARRLSSTLNLPLWLDLRSYRTEWLHSYCLHHFNIVAANAGQRSPWWPTRRMPAPRHCQLITEDQLDHGTSAASDRPVYLAGHWQSETFFAEIADLLREELTLRQAARGRDAELAAVIRGCNAVAIHVRRGDYVSVKATRDAWGVCDVNYYRRSIEHIASRVREPHFFVFSNDPHWARENLRATHPMTIIDHNYRRPHTSLESLKAVRVMLRPLKSLFTSRPHEDLRLMSLCQHFIIANSTFSWWGAWLGTNRSKIVCAPRRWLAADRSGAPEDAGPDTRRQTAIPDGWVRL